MPPKKPRTIARKKDDEPLGPVIIRKKTSSTGTERATESGSYTPTRSEKTSSSSTGSKPRTKK